MTRLINLLGIPVVAALMCSCATNPVESGTSQIRGIKEFTVAPVTFENLTVDDQTEEDFEARSSPNRLREWQEDIDAMKSRFATAFAQTVTHAGLKISDPTPGQHYSIRPAVTKIETGYFRGPVASAVTRVFMHIAIFDASGKIVDETDVQGSKSFQYWAVDTGSRLRDSAAEAGEKYGHYLQKRTRS